MPKIIWRVTSKTDRPDLDGNLQKLEPLGKIGKTAHALAIDPSVESPRVGVDLKDGEELEVHTEIPLNWID